MPREHTGGKSIRVDVAVPTELHKLTQEKCRRHKISISDAVRIALAEWVGKPELAEGVHRGRPRNPE